MSKYRKKPAVIEAEQYKEGMEDGFEERFKHYLNPNQTYGIQTNETDVPVLVPYIETLEGRHLITRGDWIITRVRGERDLIKNDIFLETYEAVE